MERLKSKNVIWIIPDGMRAAKDGRQKARFESFDVIAKRGVSFQKVISPAASTMMSLLSFLTGSPSYAILPDYFSSLITNAPQSNLAHTGDSEVMIDRKEYPTVVDTLEQLGVKAGISSFYPPFRFFMRSLGVSIKADEDFGDELNPYEWTNEEVFEHAKKLFLANQTGQSCFLVIHCLAKSGIDSIFADMINFLDRQDFFNNDILILCPDHGFYTVSYEQQVAKRNAQHDADTGVENIITVGGLVGAGINPQVQSANVWGPDLLHTALDLSGMLPDKLRNKYKYGARSYSNAIRTGENIQTNGRVFRCDTRFARQPGGITVIIKDDLIWRFDHTTGDSQTTRWECGAESDVREFEIDDLSKIPALKEELREEFENSQSAILAHGNPKLKSYDPLVALSANLRGDLTHIFEGHTYKHTLGVEAREAKVLVFRSFSVGFFKKAAEIISGFFTPDLIDVICDNVSVPLLHSYGFRPLCYGEGKVRKDTLFTKFPDLVSKKYDICLVGYNLTPLEGYANIFEILTVLRPNHSYFINANGCLCPMEDCEKLSREIEELKNVRQRYRELFYRYGRSNAL